MQFRFILPSWEGSAHDSRILKDNMDGKGFVVLEGKYLLADAGYSQTPITFSYLMKVYIIILKINSWLNSNLKTQKNCLISIIQAYAM